MTLITVPLKTNSLSIGLPDNPPRPPLRISLMHKVLYTFEAVLQMDTVFIQVVQPFVSVTRFTRCINSIQIAKIRLFVKCTKKKKVARVVVVGPSRSLNRELYYYKS